MNAPSARVTEGVPINNTLSLSPGGGPMGDGVVTPGRQPYETHSTPEVRLALFLLFLIFGTAERTPFARKFFGFCRGENPYCRFCTFAKLIFATSQTCRIIPQISPFLPSEKAQLVSLAEIAISLQIKRPIGRHRSVRTVRSIQIFPVGSIQIFLGNRKRAEKQKK